ncbi:hypothetical protein D3C80_1441540 [compost metagenome]
MDFQARSREDYVHAGFRQALGPVDIGLFIKTCLQLYHHRDFLAVVGGVDHRFDNT